MNIDEFNYHWRIDNYLFHCVQLRQRPTVQSDSFFFGPGTWRLSHDPKQSTPSTLHFTLDYLGQITFKEQTNISAETFSFIAKLALISSDGTEFMALSMLFSH